MEKRNFLKIGTMAAAGLFLNSNMKINAKADTHTKIKPDLLKIDDSVSIIAPGTAVSDPDDIQKAVEIVTALGLKPIFGKNLTSGSGYKTRSVEERIDDIHQAFLDKSTKAVFCIRGGYGSAQLVDKIDYSIIKNNPKIFCGYSDITALHSAISVKTGLVTYHSPVLLSPFTPYTLEIFSRILFRNEIVGEIKNPISKSGVRDNFPTRIINYGTASGVLTGGNLSLISSLTGTEYQIDTKDKILLLEDVGEPPYRIDRMLNQLRLTGMLDKSAGIVFGKCSDCSSGLNQSTWDWSLGEVIDYYIKPTGKPAFYGMMFGHTSEQATIPMGCNATINADEGVIFINENAVN